MHVCVAIFNFFLIGWFAARAIVHGKSRLGKSRLGKVGWEKVGWKKSAGKSRLEKGRLEKVGWKKLVGKFIYDFILQ